MSSAALLSLLLLLCCCVVGVIIAVVAVVALLETKLQTYCVIPSVWVTFATPAVVPVSSSIESCTEQVGVRGAGVT